MIEISVTLTVFSYFFPTDNVHLAIVLMFSRYFNTVSPAAIQR
ncbi:hypothetical protein QUB70_15675 [Microcoleus sp. A003_D6]